MPEFSREIRLGLSHLERALALAVERSVQSPRKEWVLFSGGVDSAVIAKLAAKARPDIRLLTVGTIDCEDLKHAGKAAGALMLPLDFTEVSEKNVRVLEQKAGIFCKSRLDLELAIPLVAACEFARGGLLVSGSGAEELFLGYAYHGKAFQEKQDLEALRRNELEGLEEKDLARNRAVAQSFGVELALPFLDPLVVRAALSLPAILNFSSGENKRLLRTMARTLAVPEASAGRPKRAFQYGSGVHALLKRLEKQEKRPA